MARAWTVSKESELELQVVELQVGSDPNFGEGPGSDPDLFAIRGEIVHFIADPVVIGDRAMVHHADGLLLVDRGHVVDVAPASSLLPQLPDDFPVIDRRGMIVMPGFVDTHVHYPQVDVIASYGGQLLDWLERFTFPVERAFADPAHAAETAAFFLDELLRNGTTTASVYPTVHRESVDAFFVEARERNLRMAAGKVLMDRNCPDYLRDTAESGYDDSAALIRDWHGVDRLVYAVTPRFAPTSTEAQLAACGRLVDEHPGVLLQSHVAENRSEIAWVAQLYPWSRSYLDVYHRYGLVREGSVFAHCIHLDDTDRRMMADSGAAMSFCATSNLFLGSGLFDLQKANAFDVRVGIGTDVGGGTSLSMLKTLAESYKVAQLLGHRMTPRQAFHLATLGGARSLAMDGRIGSFEKSREADFVVLDPEATALQRRRNATASTIDERLFALMMLGDDRSVLETWVMGKRAWMR